MSWVNSRDNSGRVFSVTRQASRTLAFRPEACYFPIHGIIDFHVLCLLRILGIHERCRVHCDIHCHSNTCPMRAYAMTPQLRVRSLSKRGPLGPAAIRSGFERCGRRVGSREILERGLPRAAGKARRNEPTDRGFAPAP